LADHAANCDDDLVKVLVFVSIDLNNPLFTVSIERDLLDWYVETKMRLQVEVLGISKEILMYLSGCGI
jgi:hypothetical protein